MKEGMQTGFKEEELRKYGCYFFTLAKWADLIEDRDTDDNELIKYYYECKSRGYIGEKAWIKDPCSVMNYLQGIWRFTEVMHSIKQPQLLRYPQFYDDGINVTHFTLMTENGEWDSWSPSAASKGRKLAKNNPYRDFKVKRIAE